MNELFGLERQTPRRNDHKEAAPLVEVLMALRTHPAVARCERMNLGAARMGGDIITVLHDTNNNPRMRGPFARYHLVRSTVRSTVRRQWSEFKT